MAKNNEVVKKLDFCDKTIELKNKIEMGFLELGARLSKINSEKMWEGRWENFQNFCDSAMNIDSRQAYKLIGIYETLVVKQEIAPERLAPAGWTRLSLIVPIVRDQKQKFADHWVAEAVAANSRRDLEKLIKQEKTGIDPAACKHPDTYKVAMVCCRTCGDQWHEHD